MKLTPVAVAAGRKLSERLFNHKPNEYLDYQNVATVVFSHPPIGTVGLSEAQAIEQFGQDQVKVYQSSFTSMYTAVTQHRQVSKMKLVCVGDQQSRGRAWYWLMAWMKFCKVLQSRSKWARPSKTLIILLPFIQLLQKNL